MAIIYCGFVKHQSLVYLTRLISHRKNIRAQTLAIIPFKIKTQH